MEAGDRAPEAGASGDAWGHCREGREAGTGIRKSRFLFDSHCPGTPEGEVSAEWPVNPAFRRNPSHRL